MQFTKDFCLWCTHFLTKVVTNRGFRGLTYSPTIWESFNQRKVKKVKKVYLKFKIMYFSHKNRLLEHPTISQHRIYNFNRNI